MIHGIGHLKKVEKEMTEWLEARGHISLDQFRGKLSMERWPERSALERANYIWTVGNFTPGVKREVAGG